MKMKLPLQMGFITGGFRGISLSFVARLPSVVHYTTSSETHPKGRKASKSLATSRKGGIRTSPTQQELENEEPWMQEEIEKYYRSKNTLAEMMGRNPNTFSQKDVEEAIHYLLPSSLFEKTARPFLKHPSEVFPKIMQSVFDADGRPLEPAFYTGSPRYHAFIHKLYTQEKKLNKEMSHRSGPSIPVKWITKEKLANELEEALNDKQYEDIIDKLSAMLAHPESHLISGFLKQYYTPVQEYRQKAKKPVVNEQGYAHAVGRRKTAVAQVWLKRGTGQIVINDKPFLEFFGYITERQQVIYPFVLTKLLGQFDVKARVVGGGQPGKAGAVRLGISRALLAFPGDHADLLEAEKLLVRDPRMVERKKPGQKKARKKFAWVRR